MDRDKNMEKLHVPTNKGAKLITPTVSSGGVHQLITVNQSRQESGFTDATVFTDALLVAPLGCTFTT